MENNPIIPSEEQEPMELPPGFRFHPTDEELITHYLTPKVLTNTFSARAIAEADLNKSEPWNLPGMAKMGEKEWYFFCIRDRKYPTGLRTNRATDAGYWKATGKDKEIFSSGKKMLVGMKKTLVFYTGRAPRGLKSNWVMHEYRLEGKFSVYYDLPKTPSKNEWVICRVFKKSGGGKKANDSELSCGLPPLMESSPGQETSHVTCFSNSMEDPRLQDDMVINSYNTNYPGSYRPGFGLDLGLGGQFQVQNDAVLNQNSRVEIPGEGGLRTENSYSYQGMGERCFGEDDDYLSMAAGAVVGIGIDYCLWNY